MNAIEFLLKEHDKFRKVMSDIADGSHRNTTKQEIFNSLCQDLLRHEKMEQKLWYPLFEKDPHLKKIIEHLIEEEAKAEKAMPNLEKNEKSEDWDSNFIKFKKDVEHHASEEETKLFPKAETLLNESDLEKIGKEFAEFKKQF